LILSICPYITIEGNLVILFAKTVNNIEQTQTDRHRQTERKTQGKQEGSERTLEPVSHAHRDLKPRGKDSKVGHIINRVTLDVEKAKVLFGKEKERMFHPG